MYLTVYNTHKAPVENLKLINIFFGLAGGGMNSAGIESVAVTINFIIIINERH